MSGQVLLWIGAIIIIALLFGGIWGRRRRRPSSDHPTVGSLDTAEQLMRLDEAHERGEIGDEEYHAQRGKLMS